ncbi:hypothetical protein RESH_00874 [Rhodopirellula europaea SH398]|uniref:Uncharacterized protein n=1 Tax=Rhodopirellula europaea SH398 TaxID=1263868 RepID=M5SQJ0_9BACT|nr:hypothetical protein RESH_00874 [Rhodopirellula europaea SH398]
MMQYWLRFFLPATFRGRDILSRRSWAQSSLLGIRILGDSTAGTSHNRSQPPTVREHCNVPRGAKSTA